MPAQAGGHTAAVAVAFSGGRDSTALLHATSRAAQALGVQVVALHVHHGLLPEADEWTRWGATLCRRWAARGLPVRWCCERLAGRPAPGDSVEAWARRERYLALARMARHAGADLVLLGQHRRDQAETVLLQALRGAGPAGLAAMPALIERDGIVWARPWLERPREAIDAYVARHRLKHLHDPSNDDARWARNRLRCQVWPALQASFSDAEPCLAALARRAQEADAALAELAQLDLQPLRDGQSLIAAPWRRLSAARQANALRAWLRERLDQGPAESLVQRLLAEVGDAGGRWPIDAQRELVLRRGRLDVATRRRAPASVSQEPLWLDLSRPGIVAVPGWGGHFEIQLAHGRGLPAALLSGVCLQARRGGEQFQLEPLSQARSLKKQFQALGVPDHDRHGPLLWSGDRLLYVPGLGIDADACVAPGQDVLSLHWVAGP